MAKTKHPLHQPIKNPWILAVIALIIVITFVSLYVNKAPSAGQAVNVGEAQWAGGTVNLEQEGTITFTVLPTTRQDINFLIGTDVYTNPQEYRFSLVKIDAQNYQFTIYPQGGDPVLAIDTLFVGGTEDLSIIHLNPDDAIPDLEVKYQNNQVIIRNLHFVAPTTAQISLINYSTDPTLSPTTLPPIIPIQTGRPFTYVINASSVIAPEEVGATLLGRGTLTLLNDRTPDPIQNYTTRSFTYTAPPLDSRGYVVQTADVVIINATVLGQVSKAYYVFVNGNFIYRFEQTDFPLMVHWYSITQPTINTLNSWPSINIFHPPSTQLQPLALPCENTSLFTTIFADKAVKRVYTYKDGAMQVWTNQSPANDFNTFTPFQGYFLELSGPTFLGINNCPVRIVEPLTAFPSLEASPPASLQISSGWTLFALPGIVPRPLTDFTTDRTFQLYQCALGQQGAACPEIDRTTLLNPGKPYWIKSSTGFTIQYRYRDIS